MIKISTAPLAPNTVLSDLCVCKHVHYGTMIISRMNLKSLDAISPHPHLHKVVASHNQLVEISAVEQLEDLLYLDVSYNNITDLSFYPLILEVLHASHNHLTSFISFNAPMLTELDLSHNEISSISDLHLPCLRYLDLSNNNLKNTKFVQSLPALRHLNLSHNELTAIPPIMTHPDLDTLNLSFNKLSNLGNLVQLFSLRNLDLSYNNLGDLHDTIESLKDVSFLNMLDVRGNPFSEPDSLIAYFAAILPSPSPLDIHGNQSMDQNITIPELIDPSAFTVSDNESKGAGLSSPIPDIHRQSSPAMFSKGSFLPQNARMGLLRERFREEFLVCLPLLVKLDGVDISAEEKVLAINHKSISAYIPPTI
ncbi:putative flagellar associated protein [Blattamonas nauphoetae]|uniref:Flagellar associated protein n=1 Tax=Blattamonas nauphoetae TaxID=2049346 RepID=A0ABQ9YH81_9EUKA|nr:putative flagellar associated protein [Blattamonas nauphoetae]